MNIVFLLQDTGAVYGAEQATMDLAGALKAMTDVKPRFLLIEERRLALTQSHLRDALSRRQLPYNLAPVESRFSPGLVNTIRARLADRSTQILHTVGYKADIHGGMATGWGRTIPVVSTVHGWLFRPDVKERFYGWVNLRALRKFTRVITLSSYYENLLLAKGIARDRLVKIPSGLAAVPESPPASSRPDVFTVGVMGRLSWEKNHPMFLRAMRRALDSGGSLRAVIAGEGPEREKLMKLARALRLEGRIEWAGYMARDDFFHKVDVLVLTSRMENLPYSVMEAMARAKPVIATRVGGLPDLIADGATGFLVEDGDANALASCLMRLSANPRQCHATGMAGREKLLRDFTLERCVERHHRLYESLLSSRMI